MHHVVNTSELMAQGVLTPEQGAIIASRSRDAMMALVVNSVLCLGILAAGAGFVVLLGNAASVAVAGGLFLVLGLGILLKGGAMVRMFGNAAALIGTVMLCSGASFELVNNLPGDSAGPVLMALGAALAVGMYAMRRRGPVQAGFVAGAVLLMGVAMHLYGLGILLTAVGASGWVMPLVWGYAAAVIALAGWIVDVRFVTALAIAPFAQMLDASTFYFHAAYVFYSPEPTLSILQMGLLVALCVWGMARVTDRTGRHLGILAIMGFIVGNLCFLVGSLWGDVIGESWWSSAYWDSSFDNYESYSAGMDAFRAHAIVISEHVFTVAYAVALAATAFWAARTGRRGLFNAAMVFGAIHAYTQLFETFADQPLAYVIGGLGAIPLAWGMWRLDKQFRDGGDGGGVAVAA